MSNENLLRYNDEQWQKLLNSPRLTREDRIRLNKAREMERQSGNTNTSLYTALDRCISARKAIKPLQEKFRAMADKATNPIEKNARLWQCDLVQWQIERAAKASEKRLRLVDSLRTEGQCKDEIKKCGDGVKGALRFFEYWAWGFDPRPLTPIATVPLVPFDNQKGLIKWLEETVFERQTSGVIEKSRDEGGTLVCIDYGILKWLTWEGFTMLLGSRKEELVDSTKSLDTLFGKARLQLQLMPKHMLPEGFEWRTHSADRMLSNPELNSAIVGEAPTVDWGRARRSTMALGDEFAAWPYGGFQQYTAVSQTSYSFIALSTPRGKQNQFYQMAFEESSNRYVLDWKKHPWKDARWYDSLPHGFTCPKMSKEMIAQEVDRDYDASQPGRVWENYAEPYVVITMSEFYAAVSKHLRFPQIVDGEDRDLSTGRWMRKRLPALGYTGRGNDRGATQAHRNAWLWAWRPPEHAPKWLSDSIVFHREWLAPLGSITYRDIAEYVKRVEELDLEGSDERLRFSQNSHEAESERNNYALEHDLWMEGWKTNYEQGLAEIGEFLTIVDKDQPNPFRPQLMGRCRMLILVADGQGELHKLEEDNRWYVQPGTDFDGMVNLRRQMSSYHYAAEELGKPAGQMRPEKIDDDVVDILRAYALGWSGLTQSKSFEEDLLDKMKEANPGFDPDEIAKLTGWARQGRLAALQFARRDIEQAERSRHRETGSTLLDRRDTLKERSMY